MLNLKNNKVDQQIQNVFIDDNGQKTSISKIFTYKNEITEQVYPNPPNQMRIHCNFDTGTLKTSDDGNPYGHPVVNLAEDKYKEQGFTVTVETFPANAEWCLSSDQISLTDQIYHGTQTVHIDIKPPEDDEYHEMSITAVPLYGDLEPRHLKFFVIMPSGLEDDANDALYSWDFDNTLVDSKSGIELTALSGENAATFKMLDGGIRAIVMTVDDDKREGYTLAYDYINGPDGQTVDFDKGATLEFAIQTKNQSGNTHIGFEDQTEDNGYYAQSFSMFFGYSQPQFLMPGTGGLEPSTTAALRITDKYGTEFTHYAMTLEPFDDLIAELKRIKDEDYSGNWEYIYQNQWNEFAEYTSPYTGLKCRINYKDVLNSDYKGRFYHVKAYINGQVFADSVRVAGESTLNTKNIGSGFLSIRQNYSNDTNKYPTLIAGLKFYNSELNDSTIKLHAQNWSKVDDADDEKIPDKIDVLSRRRKAIDIDSVRLSADYIKPFIIDDRTIALGFNFEDFFMNRLSVEFPEIDKIFHNMVYGYIARYQYEFELCYDLKDLYRDYQPKIRAAVDNSSNYSCQSNSISVLGGWLNSSGLYTTFHEQTKTIVKSNVCKLNHYAYLRLGTPMTKGQTLNITWNGQPIAIKYDSGHYSSAIKVNQVGYQPNAAKKYAYVGSWLGTYGSYDMNLDDKDFYLIDPTTESIKYSGKLKKYTGSDVLSISGKAGLETGEVVYIADFSDFNTIGHYRLHVPNVGWSHEFRISNDTLGEAFYLHARAGFHQRANCKKIAPYTYWEYPEADHCLTFGGYFIADDAQYGQECVDPTGIPYNSVFTDKHFSMISQTQTKDIIRDLKGGWWDAADFDNRPYHFRSCYQMLAAYLLAPQNFTDGQLNIPESGDGIPDILNEVEWCLRLWKDDQREDGGISGWRESYGHESDWPWRSTQRYSMAYPNRKFSLYYAHLAAMLVRCLNIAGTSSAKKMATEYMSSAIRAFKFGINPDNAAHFILRTKTSTGTEYEFTYNENCSDADFICTLLKACLSMHVTTGETRYLKYVTTDIFDQAYNKFASVEDMLERYCPHELLFDLRNVYPSQYERFSRHIIDNADRWISFQNDHVYKALKWPRNHGFYNSQLWGIGHYDNHGFNLLIAWKLSGDEKYATALRLAIDHSMGCNSLGRSQTTRLGKVYPVNFLHHWLPRAKFELGVYEDVPGLTPYYCGWNTTGSSTPLGFNLYTEQRADQSFRELNLNILPKFDGVPIANNRGIVASWLEQNWPTSRQYFEGQDQTVSHSEFTICETCLAKAAICGVLMGTGFTPSDELKNMRPCNTSKFDVEGYMCLP